MFTMDGRLTEQVSSEDSNELNNNLPRLFSRNARDSEQVSVADCPFEEVILTLDDTGTYPVSAQVREIPQLEFQYRYNIMKAMVPGSFRGTLVDGTLQPNVRQGNGLYLHNSHRIQPETARRDKAKHNVKLHYRTKDSPRSRNSIVEASDQVGTSSSRTEVSSFAGRVFSAYLRR
jgi:hypothetical protein